MSSPSRHSWKWPCVPTGRGFHVALLLLVSLLATVSGQTAVGGPGMFSCPMSSQEQHVYCYCTNGCSVNGDNVSFPWSPPVFPPASMDLGPDTICATVSVPCTTDAATVQLLAFLGVTGNVYNLSNATLAAQNSFAGCAPGMVATTTTGMTMDECDVFSTLFNALTANPEQSVPYAGACTVDDCNMLSPFSVGMASAPQASASPAGCGISTTVGKLSITGVVLGAFASVAALVILLASLVARIRGPPKNTAPTAQKGGSRGTPARRMSTPGLPPPGVGYDSYGSDYPMAPMGPPRPGYGAGMHGPGMGPPGMYPGEPGGGYDPMAQDGYGPMRGPPRPGGPMLQRSMSMNARGPPPPMLMPPPHGSMGGQPGMPGPGQHMDDGYGHTRRGSMERVAQSNPMYDDGYGPPPPGGRY